MTVRKPDPRDLDPNLKNISPSENPAPEGHESLIVYRETYFEGVVQHVRVHGPMPLSVWTVYAEEHGF